MSVFIAKDHVSATNQSRVSKGIWTNESEALCLKELDDEHAGLLAAEEGGGGGVGGGGGLALVGVVSAGLETGHCLLTVGVNDLK